MTGEWSGSKCCLKQALISCISFSNCAKVQRPHAELKKPDLCLFPRLKKKMAYFYFCTSLRLRRVRIWCPIWHKAQTTPLYRYDPSWEYPPKIPYMLKNSIVTQRNRHYRKYWKRMVLVWMVCLIALVPWPSHSPVGQPPSMDGNLANFGSSCVKGSVTIANLSPSSMHYNFDSS